MKKAITFSMIFGAGFFAAVVLLLGRSQAAKVGGGAVATQTGDVNGDGVIDLSNAVYTLVYLFQGGPEPVALADTPEMLARVQALEEKIAGLDSIQNKVDNNENDLLGLRNELLLKQMLQIQSVPGDEGCAQCPP